MKRRILSLILALAMVLSLGLSAFADGGETQADIVDAAFALAAGETLADKTLTGTVSSIATPYSATNQNVTVNIHVLDGNGAERAIQCFRIKGDDAATVGVGDVITVTGTITNYNGLIEFKANSTFVTVSKATGDYAIKTFAGYASGDVALLVRQGEKTTVSEVTGGKDYNAYTLIVCDGEGTVTDLDLRGPGRPAGVKGDYVIPEGGFIVAINRDVSDYPTYVGSVEGTEQFMADGVKAGDTVNVYGVDFAALATTAAQTALEGASFSVVPAFVAPETEAEILAAAFALDPGTALPGGPYSLTGTVTKKTDNKTQVNFTVGDKDVLCYQMNSDNYAAVAVGDKITVTGNLKNYNGVVEFDSGCTAVLYVAPPVSLQKSYTIAKASGEATYWSGSSATLSDDGVIVTDGAKGSLIGDQVGYHVALNGLSSTDPAIVTIDLGEAKWVDKFVTYTTANSGWGISAANSVKVSCSLDGTTFKSVGQAEGEGAVYAGTGSGWTSYEHTINAATSISARYVRFEITTGGNNKFLWLEEIEVYEGEEPAIPVLDDSLWDVFDADSSVYVDGVNSGRFQGNDENAACGNAYSYAYAYDKENVYVAVQTNYAGIGTAEAYGNGTGTNLRLWFRTNDEAVVYTHFVDVSYDGDAEPTIGAKKNGSLTANSGATAIATDGVVAEAVAGEGTLFIQAKIPFSVIEAVADFGMYVTLSNGKSGDIVNNCIIHPYDANCTFDKEGMDPTKNNTFFPYTSWNSAAIIVPIQQPIAENILDLGELKIIDVITFTADDPSIGTVKISGSVDGEEYYDLNAGGAAKVNADTGVASVALTTQGYIQVRYLKVEGTDVNGTISATFKAADEGAFIAPPAGPYDFGLKDDNAYCIVMLENRVVDINAVKGDDYVVAPKNNQLIITQKVANGVYKIIANSVNAWPNQGHPELITAGIEGLNISEEGIITLADDQFAFVIVSSGSIKTAGDEQTAPAKRIDRGLGVNGYLRVEGDKLTLHVNRPAAVTVPVLVEDLGELKILNVITFTADDPSIGTVKISGSVDGIEYYDLNAGGAAKVNADTGVASVDLSKQGYIQVRYLKVEGTDVSGTIEATFKAADEGAFIAPPSGPYDFGSTNEQGYGIVMLENRVVDINAVKGDDYVVAPKNNQLIITQKVANGVYKIIANSVNAWPNQGHPELITAGIEGLNISEEGIITLADDQFAFVIVSSGAITTKGDEQTAPAKRIDRGLGVNGYLRVDGDKLTLHVFEPEAVPEPVDPLEPDNYLWFTNEASISITVPNTAFQPGELTIKALVYFSEDCEGTGSAYLNCYPYNGQSLLHWVDYASTNVHELGKWHEIVLEGYNPAANSQEPEKLVFSAGFWNKTGTIKIGYVTVLQGENEILKLDFTYGYDLTGANNMTAANKGTVWDVVGAKPVPGKYAIKTFAGYATNDVSIVVRQDGKITIGDVTGKDYNYYRVILVDADGYVVDVLEKLGRVPQTPTEEEPAHGPEDGRKDLVEIPEGGFAIGIHNNVIVAEGSVYADLFGEGGVKVDDQIELIGVDLAALATETAGTVLEDASFNLISNNFVEVPEGAYTIDYAQDWMADICVIYVPLVTGETTLGDITAITTGEAQDCTWWNAIVVDGDGKVVKVIGMVDKKETAIPEGGYMILAHGGSAVLGILPGVELGSKITLYNVDLAAAAALTEGVALRKAAFTVTAPVIERPLSYQKTYTVTGNTRVDNFKDDGVKLTDGKKSDNGGTAGSSGLPCADGPSVTVDLGDEYYVREFKVHGHGGQWGITIISGFTVEISTDGETFTPLSAASTASAAEGTWQETTFSIDLGRSVTARYVKFVPVGGNYMWIDEVEVWEGDAPVPTTIDGVLNDDIWVDAVWNSYDGYNVGTWQQYASKGTYTYKTALVEDDEYIYFAGIVDTTGVTQIRTWFRTNPEASLYTHFIDIFPDKDSYIKKNQSLTENSGAFIENAYLEYVLTESEGKTYVEYKAKKSELEIDGDFEFIPQASVSGFSNLLGAEIVHGNFVYGGKTMTNFPWVNWPAAPESDYVGLIPVTNHWIFGDVDYGGTVGVINKAHYERREDGSLRFVVGGTTNWPTVTYYYEEAKVYQVEGSVLNYNFTVDRCNTNITFIFEDAEGVPYEFPLANTALGLTADQYYASNGDIREGTVSGSISLADLVASKALYQNTDFPEANATQLKFTGIRIFVSGISDPAGGVYVDDLSVISAPIPEVTENELDLGEIVTITGVTFTPKYASELTSVEILGSVDGVNYYRLNAEASVAVNDGVATLNLAMAGGNYRAFVNVRYIKVVGDPNVEGEIDIIEAEEADLEKGLEPQGPYTLTGLNEKGYGIVVWTAEDVPEGFGLNEKGVYTNNGKALNLNSCMITIAEKVGNGVYKILWNDSNGWSAATGAAHLNTPEGVEGVDYRDEKIYLGNNQIAMLIMSSGGYNTAGDAEFSSAKWILRGVISGGFLKFENETVSFYIEQPEAVPVPEPETYLWLIGTGEDDPNINFKVPGSVLAEGDITIKALVKFGEDCVANGGLVYLNCYSYAQDEYNNWDYLMNFIDYARNADYTPGEWVEVEYTYDPAVGSYGNYSGKYQAPEMLSMGVGFYLATGTISVAYIQVEQEGEVVWSVSFENGVDFDGTCEGGVFNMTDDTKDIRWGVVGANEPEPELTILDVADFDGDGDITSDDAIYLLRTTLFPEKYLINVKAPFYGDGEPTSDDAIYLLRYTLFPERYPIFGND